MKMENKQTNQEKQKNVEKHTLFLIKFSKTTNNRKIKIRFPKSPISQTQRDFQSLSVGLGSALLNHEKFVERIGAYLLFGLFSRYLLSKSSKLFF
jgi:hypothetical protein